MTRYCHVRNVVRKKCRRTQSFVTLGRIPIFLSPHCRLVRSVMEPQFVTGVSLLKYSKTNGAESGSTNLRSDLLDKQCF